MNWDDVKVVLAVARTGTLSGAAAMLGVNQTTTSRRLAALESALAATLFTRIDGRLVPTILGETVVGRAEAMEREAAALAAVVHGGDTRPAGTVRLTATESVAARLLAPRLGTFWARWPDIRLELVAGHETLNLTRREADMALRLARPQDPGTVARRLGTIALGLYGPAGQPPPPRWVGYDESLAHLPEARWMEEARGEAPVVLRTGSVATLQEAVAQGHGVGVLPCWLADADRRLRRIDPEAAVVREVWLVIHEALKTQARVRAVSEWLEEVFAGARTALVPQPLPVSR